MKRLCILVLSVFLSACAMGNFYSYDTELRNDSVSDGKRFSVAVLEFENAQKNFPQNISAFEKVFFPLQLVQTLGQSRHVLAAYFSPIATPSTDYHIAGQIILSDGEHTEVLLKLFRSDGTLLLEDTFGYALGLEELQRADHHSLLWYKPVNTFVARIMEDRGRPEYDPTAARVVGYAKKDIPPSATARFRPIVDAAARVEYKKLLGPITATMKKKTDSVKSKYTEWKKVTIAAAKETRSQENNQNFGIFVAMMGAAVSGAAQARGDYQTSARLQSQSRELMQKMHNDQDKARVQRKIVFDARELLDANIRSDSITLGGKNHKLKGTLAQQMKSIHDKVRSLIND